MPTPNQYIQELNEYLKEQGLRHSSRREQVASVFFSTQTHIGIEDLYQKVQRVNPKIGIATVYRTLNLLVESGLAMRRDFETGAVTYERRPDEHHDHLICTSCKKVIEFHEDRIEDLQDEVARKYGFTLKSHRMELYGTCKSCRTKNKRKA